MNNTDNVINSALLEIMNKLYHELKVIRQEMLELEERFSAFLVHLPLNHQDSAKNLLHYVALRRRDLRELQERLVICGLSSLGRCESHVLANLETVLAIIEQVIGQVDSPSTSPCHPVNFTKGQKLLEQNTQQLLGPKPAGAGLTIMVTMPYEAVDNYELVRDLLRAGMGVMRINCAHDDFQAWQVMIENLKRAEVETGCTCKVAMDLGGPKIRTCELEPGPRVLHWQPKRDMLGKIIASARVWLAFAGKLSTAPAEADAVIQLTESWWEEVEVEDELSFIDAAGRERQLKILEKYDSGLLADAIQSAYITPETKVIWQSKRRILLESEITPKVLGIIPAIENYILLRTGDSLRITRPEIPGKPASYDPDGKLIESAQIGCSLPQIFRDIHKGHRILFDDGKIAGIVQEVTEDNLIVEILRARQAGQKLRADKGINLPDTKLQLPALTDQDKEDLKFIAQHADIVNYSFVKNVDDIQKLQQELEFLGKSDLGIILKIENQQAFDNLPLLLLEILQRKNAGVMIARGDLAVELGWERLVEVQEEILWMCEAAHLPVIWATQVLDGLAKKGIPTRAEISDAGAAARAECVMLNKGPNILEAVRTLHDIITRMQRHQIKKRAIFRRLSIADRLFTQ